MSIQINKKKDKTEKKKKEQKKKNSFICMPVWPTTTTFFLICFFFLCNVPLHHSWTFPFAEMFDSFAATSTAFSADNQKKEIMTTPIVVNEEEMNSLLQSWSYLCVDTIDLTYQSVLYVDTNNNNNKKEEENTDLYREAMFHCRQGFQPLHSLTPASSHDMRQCLAHLRLSLSFVPFPHKRMSQSLQERLHTLEQFSIEWETFFVSSPPKNQQRRQQRIEMWRQETLRLEQSAFPQTRRFLEWMEQLQKEDIQLHALQDNMRVTDLQDWLYHHDWFPSSTLVLLQTLADKAIASLLQKTWWFLGMCLAFSFVVRQILCFFLFFFIRKKKEQKLLQ